jgi:hypothetical protein
MYIYKQLIEKYNKPFFSYLENNNIRPKPYKTLQSRFSLYHIFIIEVQLWSILVIKHLLIVSPKSTPCKVKMFKTLNVNSHSKSKKAKDRSQENPHCVAPHGHTCEKCGYGIIDHQYGLGV